MDLFFFIPAQVDTMALKTSGLGQHDIRAPSVDTNVHKVDQFHLKYCTSVA